MAAASALQASAEQTLGELTLQPSFHELATEEPTKEATTSAKSVGPETPKPLAGRAPKTASGLAEKEVAGMVAGLSDDELERLARAVDKRRGQCTPPAGLQTSGLGTDGGRIGWPCPLLGKKLGVRGLPPAWFNDKRTEAVSRGSTQQAATCGLHAVQHLISALGPHVLVRRREFEAICKGDLDASGNYEF